MKATGLFLKQACLTSLEETWADDRGNTLALHIGAAELIALLRIGEMGKQEEALKKLKKQPIRKVDLEQARQEHGLVETAEQLCVSQAMPAVNERKTRTRVGTRQLEHERKPLDPKRFGMEKHVRS